MSVITRKRQIPTRPVAQIPERSEYGNRLWDLLCKCWSQEMENRPSADEVVNVMNTITKDGLVPVDDD
ncbi:hypothetical protein B0J17DRAFT_723377 [Rhizoctonia solani]|nr:hypothetical protein B0J17DRAFT_723377 [Rhizoctonia solani]